jgi:hypothetical protein
MSEISKTNIPIVEFGISSGRQHIKLNDEKDRGSDEEGYFNKIFELMIFSIGVILPLSIFVTNMITDINGVQYLSDTRDCETDVPDLEISYKAGP